MVTFFSFAGLKFPQILKGLQDVQAEEGAKAVFEVEVSGKPKTIKWYEALSNRRKMTVTIQLVVCVFSITGLQKHQWSATFSPAVFHFLPSVKYASSLPVVYQWFI